MNFRLFLVSLSLSIVLAANAMAAPIHLQLEDASSLIVAAETTQQAGPDGAILHKLSLTVDLGQSLGLVRKFADRVSNDGAPQAPLSMVLTYLTSTFAVQEMREYGDVSVKEIAFGGFDVASRSPVQLLVRLEARQMRIVNSDRLSSSIGPKATQILGSTFRFNLNEFAVGRVDRISGFSVVPCAQYLCDSISQFDVMVVGDAVSTWRKMFELVSLRGGNPYSGAISVMTSDFKNEILRIELFDVRITAMSDASTTATTTSKVRTTATSATATLRPARVRLTFR